MKPAIRIAVLPVFRKSVSLALMLSATALAGCNNALNGTNLYGTDTAPTSDRYRRAAVVTFFITT